MHISSDFDGGNIICLAADDPDNIRLQIRKDAGGEFFQWFSFRLVGETGRSYRLVIENAGEASYPAGWQGYKAAASYDRETWFRAPTSFDGRSLVIEVTLEAESLYLAYFAPYSMERHADLIARCLQSPLVRLDVPGRSLDGQDLDLLTIGEAKQGKAACWIIARQHPGETMAEWLMEGLLARLLDRRDPLARQLLEKAVFHIVPNMNPDGSRRGHLRTNAGGANLNREWEAPTADRSPEVLLIREKMRETGVDFFLDVHGDEALPYNFIANSLGIPSLSERQKDLTDRYTAALEQANPDFQRVEGYPQNAPGKANLAMASNHIAESFGCLAMTLEQPFKDSAITPDAKEGWSPPRCRHLGRSCLDALAAVIDDLR